MDKNPIDNIYELIRTGKVIGHKNRQEFLCSMVDGVGVNLCLSLDKNGEFFT
jgi:hypothetical protein